MVIFAHPDEGEIYAGGISAIYSKLGNRVKFLSLTNGDAGHWSMEPAALAKRRYNEAMEAKEFLDSPTMKFLIIMTGSLKILWKFRKWLLLKLRNGKQMLCFFTFRLPLFPGA